MKSIISSFVHLSKILIEKQLLLKKNKNLNLPRYTIFTVEFAIEFKQHPFYFYVLLIIIMHSKIDGKT